MVSYIIVFIVVGNDVNTPRVQDEVAMVSHVKGCHSYWWKVMKHITNQFCIFYKHLTFSEYTRPIWQLVQSAESIL